MMKLSRRAAALVSLFVFAVLLLQSGCGSSGRAAISGTVTFNGEPVDGGTINFSPENATADTLAGSAEIVGGKYSISAVKGPTPGRCKVQIYWNKKTGKKVGAPGDPGNLIDETVQVVPPQYNLKTTLSEDVKAGTNTFNYDLKK